MLNTENQISQQHDSEFIQGLACYYSVEKLATFIFPDFHQPDLDPKTTAEENNSGENKLPL